jgi:hypothetical protein
VISLDLLADLNLVRVLTTFARWRRCTGCGALVLYVDDRCATESDFSCGGCYQRAQVLALSVAPPVSRCEFPGGFLEQLS